MAAKTVAQELIKYWVLRFVEPAIVTTNQGQHFKVGLLNQVLKQPGIERIHATSYHFATNCVPERWHRDLEAALMCAASETDWYFKLPFVLLDLRSLGWLDANVSLAEMLFGYPFCTNLIKTFMNRVKPIPVFNNSAIYI